MKDGHYKVKTPNYVFDLGVTNYSNTYSIQCFDISNDEGPYVELTFDERLNTVLKLDNVSRCSEEFKNVETLMSVLKLCVDAFPTIKRVLFKDISSIDCDGIDLTLSYYYLLKHGKTWYEHHFGAKAKQAHLRTKLNNFRSLLKQNPRSGVFSFYKREKFETWHDYFKSRGRQGNDYSFFIEHQKKIERVLGAKLMYSEWYISPKVINKYDIDFQITKFKNTFDGCDRVFPKNQRFTMEDAL